MLKNLRIKNIGLISDLSVEFGAGFNVLTGETGAGKSMILSALYMILGERMAMSLLKKGRSGGMAEALFDEKYLYTARELLRRHGVFSEEGEFIVRRLISPDGKSRALVNGSVINLSALRQAGEAMVDIHGQHDHQALLKKETHLPWLNHYLRILSETDHVAELLSKTRAQETELNKLIDTKREVEAQKEFLEYKLEELEKADLKQDEESAVESEHKKLANAGRLRQSGLELFEKLYESDSSVIFELEMAAREMERLRSIDVFFEKYSKRFSDLSEQISDAAMEIQSHCSAVENDPAKLEALEERLAVIENLKRKYKRDFCGLTDMLSEIKSELASIETADEECERLERALADSRGNLLEKAEALHKIRLKGISEFKREVQKELLDMNMPDAKFEVDVSLPADAESGFMFEGRKRKMFPHGFGEFRFMFSANVDQPPAPLVKIASGGEISRVMLALKCATGKSQPVPVLVFDEIDAGIGGKTADLVGEKLKKLSKSCQIICITHLPQIARQADHHHVVEKKVRNKQTSVSIRKLDEDGRVEELARMGAGREVTEAARRHAREMIRKAL